jgi:hypothetical protein
MRFNHPKRTIHLIDVENLCGNARPSRGDLRAVRTRYESVASVGPDDHVVIACNHGVVLSVADEWPGRLIARSGPNGADLALIDVVNTEAVADRFDHVVVASGDGIFAEMVARLTSAGAAVTVVSRPESLSRRLKLAAGGQVVALLAHHDPAGPTVLGQVA